MKIAVLPGDGIGPEIVRQAVKVIERLKADGLAVETATAPIGGAGYEAAGRSAARRDARARAQCRRDPAGCRRWAEVRHARPPAASGAGPARIRKALGLFTNLRPAMVYEELADASSLRPEVVAGLDIMILRELTGDIYFGSPRGVARSTTASARASTR
jgi:3-isopropylmalate dehydrogenase